MRPTDKRLAIAGVGESALGRKVDRALDALLVDASRRAIADAGLEPTQVDGIIMGFPSAFSAGFSAGGAAPKSTAGGFAISASFSTVKFGFTLNLKSIAVRFEGNERTVVLNCCTEAM